MSASNPQTKEEVASELAIADGFDSSDNGSGKHRLEARPDCFSSTFSEIMFVVVCTFAIASVSLLTGTVTVVTNSIGRDLHMDQAEVTWLYAAPSLTCGSFMLLFGRLADLFGRKTLFVGSMFCFAVLALGAGFCKQGIALDTVEGLMGLAGAAVVPAATGGLGNAYPNPGKRKNYAFACFSAGNPVGFVLGTISSGIAAVIFDWRASFFLLAIIYVIVTILAVLFVPRDTAEKLPWNRETLKKFDVFGALLGISSIALFTSALTLGGSAPDGWRTSYVIALLIVGFFLIIAFVLWELRYPFPIMPMWIWKQRDFTILNCGVILGMASFTSALFWVALYIQRFWTDSPVHVAAYVLPCAIMGIIANIVVGSIMHRFSNKVIFCTATAVYTIAFLLLAVNKAKFGYWPLIFPALTLVVWGADLQFCIANMYVISAMPLEQQSLAGGIFQTMARFGSTIGSGLTTAIFNAVAASPPITGYYAFDQYAPYAGAMWFGVGACSIAFVLALFLRIKTQGHAGQKRETQDAKGEKSDLDSPV